MNFEEAPQSVTKIKNMCLIFYKALQTYAALNENENLLLGCTPVKLFFIPTKRFSALLCMDFYETL